MNYILSIAVHRVTRDRTALIVSEQLLSEFISARSALAYGGRWRSQGDVL
jgi:hypothetical protein